MDELKMAIAELARELHVRDRVYPRLVLVGKLSQSEADRRRKALQLGLFYLETELASRINANTLGTLITN